MYCVGCWLTVVTFKGSNNVTLCIFMESTIIEINHVHVDDYNDAYLYDLWYFIWS